MMEKVIFAVLKLGGVKYKMNAITCLCGSIINDPFLKCQYRLKLRPSKIRSEKLYIAITHAISLHLATGTRTSTR